jgi:hypothetical protein
MPWLKRWLISVVVAILVAGPMAAAALIALPDRYRGPWVPAAVAVLACGVVAGLRRSGPP